MPAFRTGQTSMPAPREAQADQALVPGGPTIPIRRAEIPLSAQRWQGAAALEVWFPQFPCCELLGSSSPYCWTRSTSGMMTGGCANSMPSSSMMGPR